MNTTNSFTRHAPRTAHKAFRAVQLTTTNSTSPPSQARTISHTLARKSTPAKHTPNPTSKTPDPLDQVFAKPTWSVHTSLLNPAHPTASPSPQAQQEEITPQILAHHLRLCALPPPSTPQEESRLLADLRAQLRFVRDVQAVPGAAAGEVEPLRAIRDETSAGASEATVGLEAMRAALAREERFGFRGRPRRRGGRDGLGDEARVGDEETLVQEATAERRERGYYVVESGKVKGGE